MQKRLNLTGATLLLVASGGAALASDERQSSDAVPPSPTPRIIGGISTSITQVPATVALLRKSQVELDGDLFQAQYCAGTVVAARWVLTAAHCVTSFFGNASPANSIMVLAGSSDLSNPVNQPIGVRRIIRHPQYIDVENGSDIALLELMQDAAVNPVALDIQPVQLNDLAFIAGWGATNDKSNGTQQEFPMKLKGAFVNMTPSSQCERLYPAYAGLTHGSTICAGLPAGGKDTCQGDSGGPMYRVNREANRVSSLIGITSWGVGCGLPSYPGIYTNVTSFYGWIQSIVQTQPANDALSTGNPREPFELPTTYSYAIPQELPQQATGSSDKKYTLGAPLPGLLLLIFGLLWRCYSVKKTARPTTSTTTQQSQS